MKTFPGQSWKSNVWFGIPSIALVLLSSQGWASAPVSLTFFTTDSPPIWSERMEQDGLGGEILHALARQAKVSAQLVYLPLKRYEQANSGHRAGNPDFFQGQEFGAIVPLLATHAVFCHYKPHLPSGLRFSALEDLKGLTLGVERGTLEDKDAFAHLGINVEENATPQGLFKKLRAGRVDLILVLDIMAHHHIEMLFPGEGDDFQLTDISGGLTPIAMMLDKHTPQAGQIAKVMFEALEHIVADGTYERILRKHYGAAGVPAHWQIDLRRLMGYYRSRRIIGHAD